MGCFSWMFADTGNKQNLVIGQEAYVPCPNGTVLYEPCYEGYGRFCGKDIYVLVAEWNRDFMSEEMLRKPTPERWGLNPDGMGDEISLKCYEEAVRRYEATVLLMNDFANMTKEELMNEYGWTEDDYDFGIRILGIGIACYDEQNTALKYPIKICKRRPDSYESVSMPSKDDPNQGFY